MSVTWERKGEWVAFRRPVAMSETFRRRLALQGGVRDARGKTWYRLFPPEAPRFEPAWECPAEPLYEDDFCLVVLKPAGIPVHPAHAGQTDTLAHRVAAHYALTGQACGVRHIHRLDADTSGPVLYAKCEWAQLELDARMREKRIERIYVAVVRGRVRPPSGTIDAPIGRDRHRPGLRRVSPTGKPARTHYRTLETFRETTLLELRLETGRTHQIRVHLSHFGHPIVGDAVYGGDTDAGIGRPALHGASLSFPHPAGGGIVAVEAPWPDDFAGLVRSLRAGPGLSFDGGMPV